jgi:N-formylglutamate amidohydrolase
MRSRLRSSPFFALTIALFMHQSIIVEPERFPDDADEPMSKKGMGAVYTRTSDGRTLKRVSRKERDGLMQRYYWPHQHELERCVGLALDAHGKCLIIDCHSFASIRLPYEDEDHAPRPEICLGTDPFHTPPWLLDRARHAISAVAWELAVNRPFSGSIVPKEYFRADRRVWSIMIEVRRDLYMDEASGEKRPEFRSSLGRVIRALTEEATYRENSP